jgi:hypothetical protein
MVALAVQEEMVERVALLHVQAVAEVVVAGAVMEQTALVLVI